MTAESYPSRILSENDRAVETLGGGMRTDNGVRVASRIARLSTYFASGVTGSAVFPMRRSGYEVFPT